jgi:hypothetical protein
MRKATGFSVLCLEAFVDDQGCWRDDQESQIAVRFLAILSSDRAYLLQLTTNSALLRLPSETDLRTSPIFKVMRKIEICTATTAGLKVSVVTGRESVEEG